MDTSLHIPCYLMSASIFRYISTHIQAIDPSLSTLCQLIPDLGLTSRKAILDVCQTARHAEEYEACDRCLHDILVDRESRPKATSLRIPDLEEAIYQVSQSHVYRALVSMLVRNEPIDHLSGADQAILEGFEKEFGASQNERPEQQQISYQCLDQDNYHPAPYSIFYEPTPAFAAFARHFADSFASRLDRLGVLFPQVQRKKNMSQDSCWALYESGYRREGVDWKDYRTLDLELHASRTGIRTQGDCEMRMAWKFNELKPRYYYCTGATQYWSSRFSKHLAVELMETVPSTRLDRRQHPEDIDKALSEDDWLAIWDMTSFTTSLSELKHFLWYIAKNLEDNIRCRQRPLKCLDYADGILEIPAYTLLLEYNETVNVRAPFSIWRVLDKLYGESERWEKFEQKNSGMLGVHANIGFSTAFHGFHLEAAIKPKTGCSVGDDALGGSREDPRVRMIPHMQLIGDIQETKADILPPLNIMETHQITKFVKRRMVRSCFGIDLWTSFAFPSLADVFEIRDEYHTNTPGDESQRVMRFVGQVGAFLWSLHGQPQLFDEEYAVIRQTLEVCYRKLGLDSRGSLPGRRHRSFGEGIPLAVPGLSVDWCQYDWAEFLWDNSVERWALLPVEFGPLVLPPYEDGLVFVASEGGLLNILEDVGCVEKLRMATEWVEVSVTNKRAFRSLLNRQSTRGFVCRYLPFVPHWYHDVASSEIRVPMCYGL
jgi:hypothetical protein